MKNQAFIHDSTDAIIIKLSNKILYCGYNFTNPHNMCYKFFNIIFDVNDGCWSHL